MRRWVWLAAVLVASGCAAAATNSPPMVFAGPPALPAPFVVADAPPLPGEGPLGRGVLIYTAVGRRATLLLDDGRQFTLPRTPPGEGRQGSLYETLSPDGRWLGLRTESSDHGYVVRELGGTGVVETSGRPVAWSTNGQYLIMANGSAYLKLIEPATGLETGLDGAEQAGELYLTGLLPDRTPVFGTIGQDGELRWQVGPGPAVTVAFTARPDDDGWLPATTSRLAPDGATVAVQLRYQRGLVPGTEEKASPAADQRDRVVVLDRTTGAVRAQWTLPQRPDEPWSLAADTGAGLLFRVGWPATALVLLDRETGALRAKATLPAITSVLLPGEHGLPSDG